MLLIAKRVTELQEWRADTEASVHDPREALELSRALLDHATRGDSLSLSHSVSANSVKQLKRRVQRLVQPPKPSPPHRWGARLCHGLILLIGLGSLVACAQFMPPKLRKPGSHPDSPINLTDTSEQEATQREIEARMSRVKNAADTADLIAIEFKVIEKDAEEGQTSEARTSILSPTDTTQFMASLGKAKLVSYPRVLTLNRRVVVVRSVINEPVVAGQDAETGHTQIQYLPIGTVMNVGPVILKTGEIYCDLKLSFSEILGEERFGGNRYPIAASRVYDSPHKIPPGQTLRIDMLDETKKNQSLVVLVTPTRLLADASNPIFEDDFKIP